MAETKHGKIDKVSGINGKFKRSKPRSRTAPARKVVLSAEDRKAYEELVQGREERGRTYDRHLPSDKK
jgi:hypothetical protein